MELGPPCLRATQGPGTRWNPGLHWPAAQCFSHPLHLCICLETGSLTQEPHNRSCMDSCGFFSTLLTGGSGPPRILPGWSPQCLLTGWGRAGAPGASLDCGRRDGAQKASKNQPRASSLGSLREDMGRTALWRGQRPFSECGLRANSTEIIRRTCEIYIFLALHLKFRVTGKLHTKDLQISSH